MASSSNAPAKRKRPDAPAIRKMSTRAASKLRLHLVDNSSDLEFSQSLEALYSVERRVHDALWSEWQGQMVSLDLLDGAFYLFKHHCFFCCKSVIPAMVTCFLSLSREAIAKLVFELTCGFAAAAMPPLPAERN
jgi:hypothetical protein